MLYSQVKKCTLEQLQVGDLFYFDFGRGEEIKTVIAPLTEAYILLKKKEDEESNARVCVSLFHVQGTNSINNIRLLRSRETYKVVFQGEASKNAV